jgi:aldose 1-epimerase
MTLSAAQSTKDTEHTLTWANHTAVVSPFGAALRRYFVKNDRHEWNVIWGYSGGNNKKGGQGDVLIPFPGRIKNASYKFDGVTHSLKKNDKDGPNAIHGFLRTELFDTVSLTDQKVVYSYEVKASLYAEKGFPFSLRVQVSYAIGETGLTTTYKVTNAGNSAAPVGIGFHPYFRAEKGELADWSVKIPAQDYIELENYVPTGRVLSVDGSKLDFRRGRLVGTERFNDCLAHLERGPGGFSYITLQNEKSKNRIVLTIDRNFDYIVVYTGDQIPSPHQRQGFAIEPMTCAPDAFNHEDWGTQVLSPGVEMSGAYTILADVNQNFGEQ